MVILISGHRQFREQNVKKNYKPRESNLLPICYDTSTRVTALHFGMCIHAKFCQSIQGIQSSDNPSFINLHRLSRLPLQQCMHYHATL